MEPVTSALPVNTPLPSTSPEPALAELQNNIITVTKDGELILKNTYTKTESDPETVTISIPIYKKVGQGGNTAPGKQTFTFVLSDFGVIDAASQVTVANNTIETNGAGHYGTVMTVTVDKNNIGNLSEGFKVTERNDGAPYWAYDATEWYVVPGMNNDQSTYCTFYNLTAGDKPRPPTTASALPTSIPTTITAGITPLRYGRCSLRRFPRRLATCRCGTPWRSSWAW